MRSKLARTTGFRRFPDITTKSASMADLTLLRLTAHVIPWLRALTALSSQHNNGYVRLLSRLTATDFVQAE